MLLLLVARGAVCAGLECRRGGLGGEADACLAQGLVWRAHDGCACAEGSAAGGNDVYGPSALWLWDADGL